jgi:hypothetical protein
MNKINKLKDLIDEHFFKLKKLINPTQQVEQKQHLTELQKAEQNLAELQQQQLAELLQDNKLPLHNMKMEPCENIHCINLECNLLHKCVHYDYKYKLLYNNKIIMYVPPKHSRLTKCEVEINSGGLTNVGVELQKKYSNAHIGTMVAGNSGRPGGSCGQFDGNATGLYAYHTTQEEDVVSNWLRTTSLKNKKKDLKHIKDTKTNKKLYTDEILFKHTIHKQWGMEVPDWENKYFNKLWDAIYKKWNIIPKFIESSDKDNYREIDYTNTIQRVDYTKAEPYEYADAWVVRNAHLSEKKKKVIDKYYDFNNTYLTTLVFVAGPNCGQKGITVNSSMTRTFNTSMEYNYDKFKEGVEAALFAGLCAMAAEGCTIALLAYVSAGIYSGNHKAEVNKNYESIVNEVLKRECYYNNIQTTLGNYFDKVILTKL